MNVTTHISYRFCYFRIYGTLENPNDFIFENSYFLKLKILHWQKISNYIVKFKYRKMKLKKKNHCVQSIRNIFECFELTTLDRFIQKKKLTLIKVTRKLDFLSKLK